MSNSRKSIKLLLATIAIIIASIIMPFNAAFASNGIEGAGEKKLANFLLAYGMHECFKSANDDVMNDRLLLGDQFSAIMRNSAVKTINLGSWMNNIIGQEDENNSGVTCETIFKNVLGSDATITTDLIRNADGILNGAYLEEEGVGYTIDCQYNIWSEKAWNDSDGGKTPFTLGVGHYLTTPDGSDSLKFSYPQGYLDKMPRAETYVKDPVRLLSPALRVNKTDYGNKIQITYDDGNNLLNVTYGVSGLELTDDDGLTDYIKEEFSDVKYGKSFSEFCKDLILDGDSLAYYLSSWGNGKTPYCYGLFILQRDWGLDCHNLVYGEYPYGIDMRSVMPRQAVAPNTGKLLYQSGAGKIIAENIRDLYFNGEDPQTYFNNNPDIAYVYYGRLLFNGDGKFDTGCGGISVAADDPKIEELNKVGEWNSSNDNVIKLEAYDESGNNKEFITKFSTDATNKNIKKVSGTPWDEGFVKCDTLVSRLKDSMGFNGNSTAKSDVYGYISPKSAESLIPGTGSDPPGGGENPPGEGEEGQTEADLTEYNCYTNAGSLGWIVCPIIDSLKDFIQEKYAQWVAPALKVDVELFQWGDEDGAYYAWNIFRNIANILFVIFFVIIIFSQITGYGIDNYGVKKAFPKLLIGAILINLSFILCQVAIDLGNIAGAGIGGLFKGITNSLPALGSKITVDGVDVTSDAWEPFTSTDWTTAIIVIVSLISLAAVLAKGLAIVIPIVMAMISIAISIFALIAILGIRQAAAVLLVVASPIAFACYILPNTKSLFQKWYKAFQGLLLAYPVCSALVYGGDMVSHILIRTASGNMWIIIAAAVVSIAPIFFIPKVISNCMGAISMGMVAIANKGRNKAKGAVGKRLDNSFLTKKQKYKQQMRNQKAAARSGAYAAKRGQRIMDKYKGHEGELTAGQRRKYNAAQAAVNAQKSESENAYGSMFDGLDEGQKKQKILEAAGYKFDKNGNVTGIDKNKKLDGDMLTAGLRSMKNSAEMGEVFKTVSQTGAFKNMMRGDSAMQQRLAGVMMGSEGNAINQSVGQLMAEGKSVDDILSNKDGMLAGRVSGMGAGVMASQKAETFKMEGAANLFSDDQLREAAAAGYTGDHQENFYNMMQNVSTERKGRIVHGMNAQQVGRLRVSNVNGVDHGSLGAVGGAALVKEQAKSALNIIRSADGNNIRVAQQGAAAEALETAS